MVSLIFYSKTLGSRKRDMKDSRASGGFDSSATRETDLKGVAPTDTPANGNFESFPEIDKKTVDQLISKGFKSLFPIQQNCFYPVYNREDMIARDLTGSGKTFAFGLPLIQYLRNKKMLGSGKVQAIMLAPTRELAIQIANELSKIKHSDNDFKMVTVYGGVSVG